MIFTIKAKECKQLADGRWQLTTDCESLKEALKAHSPNILVEHLNERCGPLQTSPTPPKDCQNPRQSRGLETR